MRYQILGDTLPVVICRLDGGESMITEKGSMAWMSPNMRMDTSTNGGLGKAFGRMFSGEAIFQNIYTAQGGAGEIAFASSFMVLSGHFIFIREKKSSYRKVAFLQLRQEYSCPFIFIKSLHPAFLAERDLYYRGFPAKESCLPSLTDM